MSKYNNIHILRTGQNDQSVDGYEKLAIAIFKLAADDYREACFAHQYGKVAMITKFFKSEWAEAICPMDPMIILKKLEAERWQQ